MMEKKKKIKLMVANNVFTVLSTEDEAYSKKLAEKVNRRIMDVSIAGRTSVTGAAILVSLNYCDELQKSGDELEALKKQLSGYLEEIVKQRSRCEELEKENKKLRSDLELCRTRLKTQRPAADRTEPLSPPVRPVRRAVAVTGSEEAAEDGQLTF